MDYFSTTQSRYLDFQTKLRYYLKLKLLLFVKAEKAFHYLNKEIENSLVQIIDESLPLELDCDASDIAIAAVLNQAV